MIKNFLCKGLVVFSACALLAACSGDDTDGAQPESGSAVLGVSKDIENTAISYCYPRYLTDAETRTIGEVFSGREITYGHLILRTEPQKRAGMYFFVMFGWEPDDISLASTIELSVDTNDNPHERTFLFAIPETHSVFREIKLGITGSDWPNPAARVNAWKIVVKSPSGEVITEKQSWLWGLKKD